IVTGANRVGVAYGWIHPGGNDIVDERIVDQLARLMVDGADVRDDRIDESRIEPTGENEGLECGFAFAIGDREGGVVTERLVGYAIRNEDGHFAGIHAGELDDGANLRVHEIKKHVAKEMRGIHLL